MQYKNYTTITQKMEKKNQIKIVELFYRRINKLAELRLKSTATL